MAKSFALSHEGVPQLIADWRDLAVRHAGTPDAVRFTRLADQLEAAGPHVWYPPAAVIIGPQDAPPRRRKAPTARIPKSPKRSP